uniref:tRNA pseudouridine synthase 3 n=1 Tax=Caligus clemensi TaxID=344056 RepID=C1C1W1_CALCM|nr:tRNA pseudouridine synthase 3 [Caligus clemensi]
MDYSNHSREDLLEEIRRLKSHVLQLRNVIAKRGSALPNTESGKKKRKKGREFDFNLYKQRKVLLQICYFGWSYHGFAVQEDSPMTIEGHLFNALSRTCLIRSRETSNYHRCGRTDKGVSAFRQVVSIELRSNLLEGPGVFDYPECRAHSRPNPTTNEEIDYCKILNSNLPPDIQVIAWAPLTNRDFSARFDCKIREYKYIFPLGAARDLSRIQEAGAKLLGSHDFRNFCKMDVSNGVLTYIRRMLEVSVSPLESSSTDSYSLVELKIVGNAFLWHQIRCIVTVLFHIGQGLEEPSLIDELLDVEKHPRRPQYGLASEIPLNLFDCSYGEEGNISWIYEVPSLKATLKGFQSLWTQHAVKARMIRICLGVLEERMPGEVVSEQLASLLPHSKQRTYTPFLEMLKCPSLEEKIETANKRRRKLIE